MLAEAGRALFGRVTAAAKSMAGVLGAAILGAFLTGTVSGFEKSGAFKAASYACLIAAASIASTVFYECLEQVVESVESLAVFMRCVVPVMIAALMSSGAVVSASALEPSLLAVIEISVALIKSLFLPLVMIGAGIGIVNSMSEEIKTGRLIGFINGFVKYGLSVLLTIFVAFAGLRSVAASAEARKVRLVKSNSACGRNTLGLGRDGAALRNGYQKRFGSAGDRGGGLYSPDADHRDRGCAHRVPPDRRPLRTDKLKERNGMYVMHG